MAWRALRRGARCDTVRAAQLDQRGRPTTGALPPGAPVGRLSVHREQLFQVGLGELLGAAGVLAEDRGDELTLLVLEQQDLLLDRAGSDEPVGGDHLRLPDAVG